MPRPSIGQEWDRRAQVAAQEGGAGHGGGPELLAHLVERDVERGAASAPPEGARTSCTASVVVEVADTHTDQRQALLGESTDGADPNRDRTAMSTVSVWAVGCISVCDRVAREKSSNRNRKTTVRPTRPAARMRRVTRSTSPMRTPSTASNGATRGPAPCGS